jgi:very-short-patch-repair endonuclease
MPDLSYPELRIAIEYDGDVHRDQRQWRKDVARQRRLEELGWIIVHVMADDITRDPGPFLAAVRAARARRLP